MEPFSALRALHTGAGGLCVARAAESACGKQFTLVRVLVQNPEDTFLACSYILYDIGLNHTWSSQNKDFISNIMRSTILILFSGYIGTFKHKNTSN